MIINFVGDICLQDININDFSIDDSILKILKSSDFNIANLEGPITNKTKGRPHQPCYLKSPPSQNYIYELFDIFSLANNHIMDFGQDGLIDTFNFLKKANKKNFGAGLNVKDSLNNAIMEKGSKKATILGFTRWDNAEKNSSGTTSFSKTFLKKIKILKNEGYFVIVYPHWNLEYVNYPAPDNRKFGFDCIDAGADLIIGTHPHVFQGYEKYKEKYVFHSFGNFIFHSSVFKDVSMVSNDPRLNQSFILSINIKKSKKYDYKIIPVYSDDNCIKILEPSLEKEFFKKLDFISKVFLNEKEYKKRFYEDSSKIIHQTKKVFNNMIAEQGLKSLLIRLKRIKMQDIKIFLYSLYSK